MSGSPEEFLDNHCKALFWSDRWMIYEMIASTDTRSDKETKVART